MLYDVRFGPARGRGKPVGFQNTLATPNAVRAVLLCYVTLSKTYMCVYAKSLDLTDLFAVNDVWGLLV